MGTMEPSGLRFNGTTIGPMMSMVQTGPGISLKRSYGAMRSKSPTLDNLDSKYRDYCYLIR